jgi:hypothetical protein
MRTSRPDTSSRSDENSSSPPTSSPTPRDDYATSRGTLTRENERG